MALHKKSGENHNKKRANEFFKNVVKFKYLQTTLTNKNDFHDEVHGILNSRNACYNSVQNLTKLQIKT